MKFPKYDPYDKDSQEIFYSELKKQVESIEKIENRKERFRKMSRLKLIVYKSIMDSRPKKKNKSFIQNVLLYIKQVIISIFIRIKV